MTRTSTAPHAGSTVMTEPSRRPAGMKQCHSVAHVNAAPTTTDLAALYAAQSGPAPLPRRSRKPQEVHVTLEARETQWGLAPGKIVTAWGYQGMVPGPMIVAHVGDTLVVRLINHLPEPTVIHW